MSLSTDPEWTIEARKLRALEGLQFPFSSLYSVEYVVSTLSRSSKCVLSIVLIVIIFLIINPRPVVRFPAFFFYSFLCFGPLRTNQARSTTNNSFVPCANSTFHHHAFRGCWMLPWLIRWLSPLHCSRSLLTKRALLASMPRILSGIILYHPMYIFPAVRAASRVTRNSKHWCLSILELTGSTWDWVWAMWSWTNLLIFFFFLFPPTISSSEIIRLIYCSFFSHGVRIYTSSFIRFHYCRVNNPDPRGAGDEDPELTALPVREWNQPTDNR